MKQQRSKGSPLLPKRSEVDESPSGDHPFPTENNRNSYEKNQDVWHLDREEFLTQHDELVRRWKQWRRQPFSEEDEARLRVFEEILDLKEARRKKKRR
jgi:hypothetical protein